MRDCYGGDPNAYFDNPASVGVFDASGQYLEQVMIDFSGVDDTISVDVPNSICNFPPTICIHRTIYEGTVILPTTTNEYILSYQRCCRTGSIANIIDPLSSGMTFFTTVKPAFENTAPIFDRDIPYAVFSGTAFVYDGSATDPDGDSLVYELTTPFLGASVDFPQPQPPYEPPYEPVNFILPQYSVGNMLGGNYPLTINSETGEMVAIPSFSGVFQIGYLVKEYRNGILIGATQREFIFYITPAGMDQSYTVSGAVLLENGAPLDFGSVQILERNISTDSLSVYAEQPINADGQYSFQNIPPGVFYVKALINPGSVYFDDYLPTYYNNAALWYNADPINQCDTSGQYRNIYLIPTGGPLGPNAFEGNVYSIDTGEPVANLPLILTDEEDILIQSRTTDATGYFKFENLASGNYQVLGNLTNSSLLNEFPPVVTLPQADPLTINLFADRLSFDTTIDVDYLQTEEINDVRIFPNPTSSEIQIWINVNGAETLDLQLYNTQGILLNQHLEQSADNTGKISESIDLEDHPDGIYFLKIQGKEGAVYKKVLKQTR